VFGTTLHIPMGRYTLDAPGHGGADFRFWTSINDRDEQNKVGLLNTGVPNLYSLRYRCM
jgi:hypothetical protein